MVSKIEAESSINSKLAFFRPGKIANKIEVENLMTKQNIRLLTVVQSLEKGGRTIRIRDTNSGLQEKGINTSILCFKRPPHWVRELFPADQKIEVKEKGAGFDFKLLFYIIGYCLRNKVDILHAHCEPSYLYAGLAGKITSTPVVGTYHRSDLSYYEPKFKFKLFAKLLTACVAISCQRKELMTQNLSIPADKIWLIHGGVDLEKIAQQTIDQSTARQQLQISSADKVLLALGHLGEIKGHDILIKAVHLIKSKVENLRLYIGGDGSDQERKVLQELIKSLDLEDSVVLLGQVSNPVTWFSACDLFVMAPREEGFGLVFAEAGAMARAVVATKVGGIQDIILHEKTGLLVDSEQVSQVADGVIRLLENPTLAQKMGQAASTRVHECFSHDAMVSHYHSLIEQLVHELKM